MKKLLGILLILVVLGGSGAAAYKPAMEYWKKRNQPKWRTAKVEKGDIVSVVNATGTVKPVLEVKIGSFVSGPIAELFVDFNQEVKQGEKLAVVDSRIYEADKRRAEAALATTYAEKKRVEALLNQAKNDEGRAMSLRGENPDFISQAEMDQFKFGRMALEAQLEVAGASVMQAQASLDNSQANVDYTIIRSPVDGIIIDRKIDPGQTLAATFQTPELFVVAPDMRKKMYVYASVDEADIGLIRHAQQGGEPVEFMVDAYPDDLFEGQIEEIRFSSTQVQNVVTYPVVIAATNPDLKLLPGMTASISFRVESREDAIKVPNSALRYYPDAKRVREDDRKVLEGSGWEKDQDSQVSLSAAEKAEAREKRNRRHVWIDEEGELRAVEVTIGLSDSKFSELVSGDLEVGQVLVTGIK